jgi:hypothetical protein
MVYCDQRRNQRQERGGADHRGTGKRRAEEMVKRMVKENKVGEREEEMPKADI